MIFLWIQLQEKGRQAREIHYKDIVKDNELFKKYYKVRQYGIRFLSKYVSVSFIES